MWGDCFDPLSDRRSYEKCEDAGKNAVSWGMPLWALVQPKSRSCW